MPCVYRDPTTVAILAEDGAAVAGLGIAGKVLINLFVVERLIVCVTNGVHLQRSKVGGIPQVTSADPFIVYVKVKEWRPNLRPNPAFQ